MTWKCFPKGRKFRKTSTMTRWSQNDAVPMAAATPGSRPARSAAPIDPAGRPQLQGSPAASRSAPSKRTSVTMRPAMNPRMRTPSQLRVTRSGFVTTRRQMKASAAKRARSTATSFTKA
ncbi:MAG: hypothetical protein H6Q88_1752 [Anaeromyxobacteraceae bacterium]|nr:hypothetical protein [Anaeromyxobacteraceae bacterium]